MTCLERLRILWLENVAPTKNIIKPDDWGSKPQHYNEELATLFRKYTYPSRNEPNKVQDDYKDEIATVLDAKKKLHKQIMELADPIPTSSILLEANTGLFNVEIIHIFFLQHKHNLESLEFCIDHGILPFDKGDYIKK